MDATAIPQAATTAPERVTKSLTATSIAPIRKSISTAAAITVSATIVRREASNSPCLERPSGPTTDPINRRSKAAPSISRLSKAARSTNNLSKTGRNISNLREAAVLSHK